MQKIKFIHAADLHIESPYKGLSQSNEPLGNALIRYAEKAYDDLIQKCIDEKIDFLLIAGDSFDSEGASLSAQYHFINGLKRLNQQQIKVFIICGNHDPLNNWPSSFNIPGNVAVFSGEEVQRFTFEKDGQTVALYGQSFLNKEEFRNLAKNYSRKTTAEFSIGLLHGTLEGEQGHDPYCPFKMDDLRAAGMDYWALGHIHKREVISESKPLAVYAGNLQGRHFNESGEKGCYLVEIESNNIQGFDFISISKVLFSRKILDISGITSLNELIEKMELLRSQLLENENSYLLRLTLIGQSEIYSVLRKEDETKRLFDSLNAENNYEANFVFWDKIINETLPLIDIEERAKSNDFVGSLISKFDDYEIEGKKLLALSKRIMEEIEGKKAAYSLRDISADLEDNEVLKKLMNEAKLNCVGGLIQEEKSGK